MANTKTDEAQLYIALMATAPILLVLLTAAAHWLGYCHGKAIAEAKGDTSESNG